MEDIFENKTVLLTGGTGSFGQKFTEMMLGSKKPYAIRVYSRGELKQVEMGRKFAPIDKGGRLRFFIGDVRDRHRLNRAMNGVDIVIHAAALKHVPVCEYNPIEAVNTNIDGAKNVVDAAIDNGVERVLALSTDKAVQPVNLYGATKLVAEKLFVQANSYSGARKTKFACVRYGNVLGSSGSVVPLFIKQREAGEVTITDERMTRFWITLEQGVNFVMNCVNEMKGGEIFVPKIPSMKITEMADILAPNAKKKIVGIRPGEKLHEMLLMAEESAHAWDAGDHYVIEPENKFWSEQKNKGGKAVHEGFTYTSSNNSVWLTKDQMKKLLKEQGFM